MHSFIGMAMGSVWGVTALIWIAGAFRNKRTARRASLRSRLVLLTPIAVGYTLVASHTVRAGWLDLRLWPSSLVVEAAGLVLTLLGCGLAIWARVTLGANWSARPSVKEGHELVVRGPYRLVRHPIYSGLLLALAGSVMAVDRNGCVLGWLLVLITYAVKMRQEERLMMQTFPGDYPAYRRRVKALVPGLL